MKAQRDSSIEILRIIAICFIVISHCCYHSNLNFDDMPAINAVASKFFVLGNLGVDIFVIISGYHQVGRYKANWNRIFLLTIEVLFYSVILYIVLVCTKSIPFSVKGLIKASFPITTNQYWFMTTYIVFAMVSPYLNRIFNNLTKTEFQAFLSVLFIVWIVVPTVTTYNPAGGPFTIFLTLYSVGAYIRLYRPTFLTRGGGILLVLCSTIIMFMSSLLEVVLPKGQTLFSGWSNFYQQNSLTTIGSAVGLLAIATSSKGKTYYLINKIASCSLGVYLLHDNPNLRYILWNVLFNIPKYQTSRIYIFIVFTCSFVVMVSGTIIELLRKMLDPYILSLLDKVMKKIILLFENRKLHGFWQ